MLGHEGLLFFLLQVMIKIAVFFADENTIFSRSAYFVRQENKQLKGYVYKQFESRSLTSCSQACLRNVWCTSTNFKVSSTRDSKGTCELNKHEVPLINENTKIYDQQGVTILMIMKGCLMTGCLNGGSCLPNEKTETFSCSCELPWIGDRCEVKMPLECQNYQNLTSADRKATFPSQEPYLCDSSLGPGWFRFQGDAGVRMPTSCVPHRRCGSSATGWFNGTHPSVADGVVTRQVCFHYWKGDDGVMDCCYRFKSFTIQVVNCGSYFVYHFQGTPQSTCSLRYCGTD